MSKTREKIIEKLTIAMWALLERNKNHPDWIYHVPSCCTTLPSASLYAARELKEGQRMAAAGIVFPVEVTRYQGEVTFMRVVPSPELREVIYARAAEKFENKEAAHGA